MTLLLRRKVVIMEEKNKRYNFRLTAKDAFVLDRKLAKNNIRFSTYIRDLVARDFNRKVNYLNPMPPKIDGETQMELNKIGVNLNQISKRLNQKKEGEYSIELVVSLKQLIDTIANIQNQIKDVQNAN